MTPQRFSLDNWPPMFHSRTGDRSDPCYIGKLGEVDRKSHAPTADSLKAFAATERLLTGVNIPKLETPKYRLKEGSHAHRAYMELLAAGPMNHKDLAAAINQPSQQLWGILQRPILCGLIVKKATRGMRQPVYSVGKVRPA